MAAAAEKRNCPSIFWLKQLLLVGGFAVLMCDIRFEHREVVGKAWQAWIPIVYCALMLLVVPVATRLWAGGGKKVLIVAYATAIIVGIVGVCFHSDGHLLDRLTQLLAVWQRLVNKIDPNAPFYPPISLAFVGLGSIGLLFCLEEAKTS